MSSAAFCRSFCCGSMIVSRFKSWWFSCTGCGFWRVPRCLRRLATPCYRFKNLVHGLIPAMLFTILGFGALTHALYAVHNQDNDRQQLWPGAVWKTFSRLIAQELDDDTMPDDMELLVLLFGVLFFSVFMMNVFIGVINDQYSEEKKTVRMAFQSLRAKSCLTHLLRTSAVPCDLLTAQQAACMSTFCVMTCIVLQVLALGETGVATAGLLAVRCLSPDETLDFYGFLSMQRI